MRKRKPAPFTPIVIEDTGNECSRAPVEMVQRSAEQPLIASKPATMQLAAERPRAVELGLHDILLPPPRSERTRQWEFLLSGPSREDTSALKEWLTLVRQFLANEAVTSADRCDLMAYGLAKVATHHAHKLGIVSLERRMKLETMGDHEVRSMTASRALEEIGEIDSAKFDVDGAMRIKRADDLARAAEEAREKTEAQSGPPAIDTAAATAKPIPRTVECAHGDDSLLDDMANVSFEEQMRGWLSLMARAKKLEQQIQVYARLRAFLEDFQTRPVLDFADQAAIHFQRLIKARVRIGTMDLRIASIALSHDALLISRNLVDFEKVPELRVEDWTRPYPP